MTDRPYPGYEPTNPGAQPPQPNYPPAGQPYPPAPGAGQPSPVMPGGQPSPYAPAGSQLPPATGPHPQFAAQQPGGPGRPPMPGAPGGPGGPGYQPMGQPGFAPTPAKKPNVGLLVGLGVGALVLVILVVVLASRGGGITGPTPAEKATQTAQDYLTALSEGRATDALALVDADYITDDSLLTDEVLADSLTRAALTEIVVSEPIEDSPDMFSVPVTYLLGDSSVSDTLKVSTWDDEPYLYSGLGSISLQDGVESTVNGVIPATANASVFPGSYVVDATAEYLTYNGGPLVITKSNEYMGAYELDLVVTDEGIAMFREKVIAEAEACLASKALDAGCGLSLPATLEDGTQLHDGGVTRTQDAEARTQLQNITPEPGYSVPSVIQVYGYEMGSVDVKAECTKNGSTGVCDIWGFGLGFGDASMNLADENPVVEWD